LNVATAAVAPTLSGLQKAAILLVALGDAASAALLRHFNDDEVQRISEAIVNLPTVPLEEAEAVLEEFNEATMGALQVGHGGPEYAKRVLTQAFGPNRSRKHLERLLPAHGKENGVQQQLLSIDPQLLARFVRTEHPQTVALILSRLSPARSAAVLAFTDPKVRADVATRMARLEQISPAIVAKISTVVATKLKSLGEIQREASGGPRAVAEILNQMESSASEEVLEQIGQDNADLAEEIRKKMFVFEDLLSIDGSGVTELLSRADRRQLTVALKGATEELRQHLLKGLSQRGAAMLLEDMEALGPTKIRDVEAAQQQIIAVVRQLEGEGVISRSHGEGKNEQYL